MGCQAYERIAVAQGLRDVPLHTDFVTLAGARAFVSTASDHAEDGVQDHPRLAGFSWPVPAEAAAQPPTVSSQPWETASAKRMPDHDRDHEPDRLAAKLDRFVAPLHCGLRRLLEESLLPPKGLHGVDAAVG